MPLFTVIIPSRNRPEYLHQALDSLLKQAPRAAQIIVVDDGSETPIYDGLTLRHQQTCQVHRNESSRGVSAARNQGAALASSEWLLFLDDDDWLAPGFLCAMSRQIEKNNNGVDILWSRKIPLQEAAIQARNIPELAHLPRHRTRLGLMDATCSGMAIRREAFLKVGGFDEALPVSEDRDLIFTLLAKHYQALPAPDAGLYFRIHDGPRLSRDGHTEMQARADLTVFCRHRQLFKQQPALAERFLGRVAKRLWQNQYRLDALAVTRLQYQIQPRSLRARRRLLLWHLTAALKSSQPLLLMEIETQSARPGLFPDALTRRRGEAAGDTMAEQ